AGGATDMSVGHEAIAPLHVSATSQPPAEARHTVPLANSRHAPEPSQAPSVPHVVLAGAAHWLSGSWPAGTDVHVPTVPASAHDWQVPAQPLLQQKPCAQLPELHCGPVVHGCPMGSLPQLPSWHVLGARQSALVMHVVLHRLVAASHRNG